MMGLTFRQRHAYDFIAGRLQSTGVAPTVDEIRQHLGMSGKSGPHAMVKHLVRGGWLRKLPRRWQALELTDKRPARVAYFKFDDETKKFRPWPEKPKAPLAQEQGLRSRR